MEVYDLHLISLTIRKWELDKNKIFIKSNFVLNHEEYFCVFELSLSQVPDMVDEYINKVKDESCKEVKKTNKKTDERTFNLINEPFVQQKLNSYFKRIFLELNNPKRKKGQSKMIYTTHLDFYDENQDISFLDLNIQFFVILSWARRYYEKTNFQEAIEPLKKLMKITIIGFRCWIRLIVTMGLEIRLSRYNVKVIRVIRKILRVSTSSEIRLTKRLR